MVVNFLRQRSGVAMVLMEIGWVCEFFPLSSRTSQLALISPIKLFS